MPKSLLQQLRTMTTVVADTGDIEAIEQVKPQDATTNPSLITAAAQMPQYQSIVDGVLLDAKKKLGEDATDQAVAKEAFKHLAIAFGSLCFSHHPGTSSMGKLMALSLLTTLAAAVLFQPALLATQQPKRSGPLEGAFARTVAKK